MLYNNVLGLVGNTPLVKLNKISEGLKANIYLKIEKNNLSGSIKDRASLQMIQDLLKEGRIKEGGTIIEPTSGNTGIGLACLSNYFNLKCIIVMPSSMSFERRKLIKDYNAQLVLVDGGMKECVDKANELQKEIENSVVVGQFENPSNYMAHYLTTAKEILDDLSDTNVIISGIGTGGTIVGIGKYIKENDKNIEVIGFEPESSPLLTKGYSNNHKIQGIGANFIPGIFDEKFIDKIYRVNDDEAIETAKELLKKEALFLGISSGAGVNLALKLAKQKEYEGKNIVVICPDSGERYTWN